MQQQNTLERNCALFAEQKNFATLFELTCAHGQRAAALYLENNEEKQITFTEYRAMSDAYAAFISDYFPKGGYVAIAADTCKEWFPMFWGVMRSGHSALLIDASLPDGSVRKLMEEAGCTAIISQRARQLGDGIYQLPTTLLFSAPRKNDYQPVYGDSVALCTSGTTGQSRVFVYNGEAIAEQVLSSKLLFEANKRFVNDEARRSLVFLPFHHVLGFIVNLLWCGFLGYSNIYLKDRTPETILETARRFQPQLLVAVPLLANNLCASLRRQLSKESRWKRAAFSAGQGMSLMVQSVAPTLGLSMAQKWLFAGVTDKLLGKELQCVILGGSHTPVEQLRLLNALGYYTVCGFGMTETAITSVETGMSLRKRLSGSVGKPLSNVHYRLKPGSGKRRGEMLIKGSSLHTGRLQDGQLLPPNRVEDGWYPTGDLVRLTRSHRMFVEGRCKEVIINESGENVYPDELEDLFDGLEGVEQFSVLGVPKPGKGQRYEDVTLVLGVGRHYSDVDYLSLLSGKVTLINRKLPAIKRLTRVIVTPEPLPLVNGIKVKRLALRERIAQRTLECRELSLKVGSPWAAAQEQQAVEPTADHTLLQQVRGLYADALGRDDFANDAHFIDDLGGDSLQVLSLTLRAEELFGVLIAVEEYGRCATVNELTALIEEKRSGKAAAKADEPVVPITRFEDAPEYLAFQKRQQSLLAHGEDNPYFVCHDSPLRDTSMMAGREVLNFGSYNYVGMSGRAEVSEAAKAAIDRYGTSASGSRLLAGEKTLYQQLEKEIAQWKHTQSALVCVGGHSTNVTFVGNFCGEGDLIVYDALAHNSIEQGCRLSRALSKPFPHNDPEALESILKALRGRFGKALIVIEGAYSMDGDVANVPAFVELKKKYGCFLMVDEAHSSCVIGETGGGVDEYFHLEPTDIDVKMGTLSKGLGTCGGYLAGSSAIIEYLRYSLPGFVFSVGISPALAAGALESIRQLKANPQIMRDMKRNISCFVDGAKKRGFDICLAGETAIIPVLVGKDEDAFALSAALQKQGVFVPPAVYPAVPKNKARLRFCVISDHKPEQIEKALDVLAKTAAEMHIDLPKRQYA
ncbi:MAG: aminotransferase class I/II-fold pyridoxal phosphate-dependent enzyme [Eubacteriales bacterium]|nr:aminotransferase class I/II-fold pyridoxal phosphate-dependent enzyme [Eubacteriales bacterium]